MVILARILYASHNLFCRAIQKSVLEPLSLGAALYSEVSIYPEVAAKAVSSVFISIEFPKENIHIMLNFTTNINICKYLLKHIFE